MYVYAYRCYIHNYMRCNIIEMHLRKKFNTLKQLIYIMLHLVYKLRDLNFIVSIIKYKKLI